MEKLKVLVPLDGSTFSRAVLNSLKRVLSPRAYALTLLRVTVLPKAAIPYVGTPARFSRFEALTSWSYVLREVERGADAQHPVYLDEAMKTFKAELVRSLGDAKAELEDAGFDVEVNVQFGDPATEIAKLSGEGFDLVALATHGRTGLNRLVLGSVAESVLRSVTIPVLMVRPPKELAGETLAGGELSASLAGA